jgi:hypothetical protein
MRKRLGLAFAFILVTLALMSAPAQATCPSPVCLSQLTTCQRNCGHVPSCTDGCRALFNDCNCRMCGVC